MSNQQLGIQDLKEGLLFVAHTGNLVARLRDGIQPSDINYVIPVGTSFLPAYQGRENIIPQLRDIDAAEQAELETSFNSVFDIDSEYFEEFFEDAMLIAFIGGSPLSLFGFVDKWFLSGRLAKK